jgi:predicted ATPase
MEFVRRAYVPAASRLDGSMWPFSVPAVADLAHRGLELTHPVTFLVGDNGTGKSTIVEALAEGFELDARGGRAARALHRIEGHRGTKTILRELRQYVLLDIWRVPTVALP